MGTKQAENEFTALCRQYNLWCHKWRDVSFCPHCKKPIFMTARKDETDTRQIRESIVDYLVFVGAYPTWVECKGKSGQSRFAFADLYPHQRQFLTSWQNREVATWIFLTFGPGRVPHDRKAWLIPINAFLGFEKFYVQDTGRKSVSFDDAVFYFNLFELDWGSHDNGRGGWLLPPTHMFIQAYPEALILPPLYEEQ
jgi:penicillin-binding protein-related factor A (putative recombinase)